MYSAAPQTRSPGAVGTTKGTHASQAHHHTGQRAPGQCRRCQQQRSDPVVGLRRGQGKCQEDGEEQHRQRRQARLDEGGTAVHLAQIAADLLHAAKPVYRLRDRGRFLTTAPSRFEGGQLQVGAHLAQHLLRLLGG